MNVLVTGGSGSGKSAYAEQLACRLSPKRTYLATMGDQSNESQERIRRHRSQRAGLQFSTIERTGGTLAPLPPYEAGETGVVLLDDLGNLVANALFLSDGSMANPDTTLNRLEREIAELSLMFEHVVVVGNEVGSAPTGPYPQTRVWVRLMGSLCCRIAAAFDYVIEVVAGVPLTVKGELP